MWIDDEQPEQAEYADAEDTDDGRSQGTAHASQGTGEILDQDIDPLSSDDDLHAKHTQSNDIRIPGVDRHQGMGEQIDQAAAYENTGDTHGNASANALPAALDIASTVILANEGDIGLGEGVQNVEDVELVGDLRRIRRDGVGSQGVDVGLNHNVGEGEDGSLKSGGQSDGGDVNNHLTVELQPMQVNVKGILRMGEKVHQNHGTDHIGNDCGQSDAGDAHLQHDDEEQIQQNIQDTTEEEGHQRGPCITLASEEGAGEVVQHDEGHAGKVDTKIQGGQGHDVCGSGDQLQDQYGEDLTDDGQYNTADQGQNDGGMGRVVGLLVISASQIPGNHSVGSDGETDEHIHHHIDQGTVGADGGQGFWTGKAANYSHICRIKELLQHTGAGQGDGNLQNFGSDASLEQIHGSAGFCSSHDRR